MSLYTVTYLNENLGQRCPLIENIPIADVLRVLAKFGDPRDPSHWLPELAFHKVGGAA